MKYLSKCLFFLCVLPFFAQAVPKNNYYYVVTIANNTNNDLPYVSAEGDYRTSCRGRRSFKKTVLNGSTKAHQSMDLLIYVPKDCLNKTELYVAINGGPGSVPSAYCHKIKDGTYTITGPFSTPVGPRYKCNGVLSSQHR